MIQIKLDTTALERHQRALSKIEGGTEKAGARALRRSMEQGRTALGREVRRVYLIKQSDFYSTLTLRTKGMVGEISSKYSGMLRLDDFKVRPGTRTRPAWGQVKKGGGGTLGRAFVFGGRTFARKTQARLPIERLQSISGPIMASQPGVAEPAREKMAESFEKRLDHEIKRLLATA